MPGTVQSLVDKRSFYWDNCLEILVVKSLAYFPFQHWLTDICVNYVSEYQSWVIFHFASTVALCCCFFCINGISCGFSATVTPRCRCVITDAFQNLSFLPQIVVFGHIISFELLCKPSTQILFLLTHFVISCISLLNVFSADSLFISLKIDFSHIVVQREINVGYHGWNSVQH